MSKFVQLLRTIVPENVLNNCIINQDGFVCHFIDTESQAASHTALIDVLRAGYGVDILDDTIPKAPIFIENIGIYDLMSLKVVYSTSVTPPRNALYKWRINVSVSESQKSAGMMKDVLKTPLKLSVTKKGDPEVFVDEAIIKEDYIRDIKAPRPNKYMRKIKTFESHDINGSPIEIDVWVDVYDVIKAFNVTSGPLQHALKKVLCAGERGHKDLLEDLNDIIVSVEREIEMVKEGK